MVHSNRSRLDYLMIQFSLLIGVMIVLMTLVVTAINYRTSVRLHLERYHQVLETLETTYLRELIRESEYQLNVLVGSLDRSALEQGQSAYSPLWQVVQRMAPRDHYIYFYHMDTGRLDRYPEWEIPEGYDPTTRPWYALAHTTPESPHWIGPYPEYKSGEMVLTLGQRLVNASGQTIGIMMVDMSLTLLQEALDRSLGAMDAILFLRERSSGNLLSISQPGGLRSDLVPMLPHDMNLSLLSKGALMLHPLSYVDWELGIYITPRQLYQWLYPELFILLPLLAMVAAGFIGLRSLLRVFRHELDLVEGRLSQLGHEPDKEHKPDRLSAWFVDKSLIELEQIEREYLTHRKALRLDPLTGIFNRRAFDDDLALCAAAGKVYTLVMIDVDHFKVLNDNFGHPFGDLVLRRIADVLVCVFGLDHAYRIGGDEFAIILDAPRSEVANRLQQLAVRMQRQLWREGDCQVTLSMGAATGSGAAAPLIKQADAALYQSKRAGRNRWQFA